MDTQNKPYLDHGLLPSYIKKMIVILSVLTFIIFYFTFFFQRFFRPLLFLIWNLFLAGLPLVFALGILLLSRNKWSKFFSLPLWVLWLFFFPNAPYMMTDLLHVERYALHIPGVGFSNDPASWLGFFHLLVCVYVGCSYGYVSLYILHDMVQKKLGKYFSWCFVLAVCALSGFGIYLGRCLRFNTWDLVHRPIYLLQVILTQLNRDTVIISTIFALMTLLMYILFFPRKKPIKKMEKAGEPIEKESVL